MARWKDMIKAEMKERGDSWDNVIHIASMTRCEHEKRRGWHDYCGDDDECSMRNGFNDEFDAGFGGAEGAVFTLWTKDRVYFPCEYDGSEYVRSIPRNPCDEVSCDE